METPNLTGVLAIHETTAIDEPRPTKPELAIQTLTVSKPSEFGTPDLESLATFLAKTFSRYNLKVEFNAETDKIELTAQRIDGKSMSRGSFYQVRRAYMGFIRGWICHQNNHSED